MNRTRVLITATIAALALSGCASSSTSQAAATGAQPSAYGVDTSGIGPTASVATNTPAAAPSAVPSAQASSGPCTTKACIAQDAEQSLPGTVAQDESVMTKATCYKSTVRHHAAARTWTVECRVTYSDGAVVTGNANLLLDQDEITFQPTG